MSTTLMLIMGHAQSVARYLNFLFTLFIVLSFHLACSLFYFVASSFLNLLPFWFPLWFQKHSKSWTYILLQISSVFLGSPLFSPGDHLWETFIPWPLQTGCFSSSGVKLQRQASRCEFWTEEFLPLVLQLQTFAPWTSCVRIMRVV